MVPTQQATNRWLSCIEALVPARTNVIKLGAAARNSTAAMT
jgi:hypothetical protein